MDSLRQTIDRVGHTLGVGRVAQLLHVVVVRLEVVRQSVGVQRVRVRDAPLGRLRRALPVARRQAVGDDEGAQDERRAPHRLVRDDRVGRGFGTHRANLPTLDFRLQFGASAGEWNALS